jgi:hypothetical protein
MAIFLPKIKSVKLSVFSEIKDKRARIKDCLKAIKIRINRAY